MLISLGMRRVAVAGVHTVPLEVRVMGGGCIFGVSRLLCGAVKWQGQAVQPVPIPQLSSRCKGGHRRVCQASLRYGSLSAVWTDGRM